MQNEYKKSMEKIRFTDEDKARILANVKKAYEESDKKVVSITSRPNFSLRRVGVVAATLGVLVVSAFLVRGQLLGNNNYGDMAIPDGSTMQEEPWVELASIDDIAKETECKTYTLNNVSKSYKVDRVQVKKQQKHVKITYKSKKHENEILLEYVDEKNASLVTEQFEKEKELATEKVDDKEVTMYGEKDCDAMTWQQESCTFAVKMTQSCSKEKAAKIVSGTKQRTHDRDKEDDEQDIDITRISMNAVGWQGHEEHSNSKQRIKVLQEVYEKYGFRVTITEPAENITYKIIDGFESFGFSFPEVEALKERRVIGYAGREGTPQGVLDSFTEAENLSVNGVSVQVYENEEEEIYTFTKQDINFTLLVGEIEVEDREMMLSGLLSVIRISFESGHVNEEEEELEEEEAADEQTDNRPDETGEEDANEEAGENTAFEKNKESVQNIQYAIADASLKKLSTYIEFPLMIKGLNITVASAKEFQSLDSSQIFSSAWVDSVVAYDLSKMKPSSKTITMGDDKNYLVCKIKNNSVLVTELSIEGVQVEPSPTPCLE